MISRRGLLLSALAAPLLVRAGDRLQSANIFASIRSRCYSSGDMRVILEGTHGLVEIHDARQLIEVTDVAGSGAMLITFRRDLRDRWLAMYGHATLAEAVAILPRGMMVTWHDNKDLLRPAGGVT